MNRMLMKARFVLPVFAVVLIMALAMASTVSAALPAPNWMPGMPMIAGNQIILMWMVVPGAAKYNIYLNGGKVGSIPGVQHILPAPTKPGNYNYEVTAVGSDGSESPRSVVKTIPIIKLEPPTQIQGLSIGDRISLRWQPAPNAVIYDIFRKEKNKGAFKLLASIQEARFQDGTAKMGITYVYAIRSKDVTAKQSDLSEKVEVAIEAAQAVGSQFKGYKLYSLPIKRVDALLLPAFPKDIAIIDNEAVVSAGKLFYFKDITDLATRKTLLDENPGENNRFSGVSFDGDGNILATSQAFIYRIDPVRNRIIEKFVVPQPDEGELVYKFRNKLRQLRQPPYITDVVEASDGTLFATDNRNYRVVHLDSDGTFLGNVAYTEPLPMPDLEEDPSWKVPNANYISVDDKGRIFANSVFSIYVFENDELLYKIGELGDVVGSFGFVNGTVFDEKGNLWVADIKNNAVQIFKEFPEKEERSWEPMYVAANSEKNGNPRFNKPVSLAWGPAGKQGPRLYVVENITKSVAWFDVLWEKADKRPE